jgi:chemotaxis signal transduction protein
MYATIIDMEPQLDVDGQVPVDQGAGAVVCAIHFVDKRIGIVVYSVSYLFSLLLHCLEL